ncbi:MAG: MBOAT family protein [Treponema sp.]|nr:MBOAT family protein [Treponema sp.]
MLFNSVAYWLFFPLVCLGYSICSGLIKRNSVTRVFLLAISLFFYACWNPAYLSLILISVCITYFAGLGMEKYPARKKPILVLSLLSNLAILFFFKYYNWFALSANTVTGLFSAGTKPFRLLSFALPVGISFYTFQALGYSIDVYRATVKAERNFVTYALFVTFFPQLVAGPIERTENLLPQFKCDYGFDYERVTGGLKLAAWGMFMKVIIADSLAPYVSGIYGNIADAPACAVALATFFFAVQVYADFAGYSNIAIGCAEVLGFRLMKNFDHPYFSSSIPEFWRRWHISLGSWFRDYLYYPVGFASWNNKICKPFCGKSRRKLAKATGYVALACVWFATGLWHGAAWHFVAWGAVYGVYIITSISTEKLRSKLRCRLGLEKDGHVIKSWHIVQVLVTFALVNIGYVFFRANNMVDAVTALGKLVTAPAQFVVSLASMRKGGRLDIIRDAFMLHEGVSGFGFKLAIRAIMLCAILFAASFVSRREDGRKILARFPAPVRWLCYYVLVFIVALSLLMTHEDVQFIYFQF